MNTTSRRECGLWSLGRVTGFTACTCPLRTRGHVPSRTRRSLRLMLGLAP